MKKISNIFIVLVSICSCSLIEPDNNEQDVIVKGEIFIPVTENLTPVLNEKDGNVSLTFNATADWTAEIINDRASDWCTVTPSSGKAGNHNIIISVTENIGYDDRSATIELRCDDDVRTVVLTQKQKSSLTITSSKYELSEDGGIINVEVKSNIDFSYTIAEDCLEWVSFVETKGLKTHKLEFNVEPNEDITKRVGLIKFRGGGFEEAVRIYQEGAVPTMILNENEFRLTSKQQTIIVEINSNVDVSLNIPSDCSWVYEEQTKSISTNRYYLVVDRNDSYDNREATISFGNKDNGLRETVAIYQSAKEIIESESDEYQIGADGGEFTVTLESNVDYKVGSHADWITEVTTKGLESSTTIFYAEVLPSELNSREGTIEFIHSESGVSEIVAIRQFRAISLDKTYVQIVEGDSDMIQATLYVEEQPLVWTSSDTYIVTVDSEGKITAHRPGSAIITVTTEDGQYTSSCSVLVQDIDDLIYMDFGYTAGVTYSDGCVQPGSKLVWYVFNYSPRSILVKYLQIVDYKNSYEGNYMPVDDIMNSGDGVAWTITLGVPIKAPSLKIYYEYNEREYTYVCDSPFQ